VQVFLPVNIKETHWYLVVINGGKGVIQVLDLMGEAKQRPQLKQLVSRKILATASFKHIHDFQNH
jgi:Ulp1 family protease